MPGIDCLETARRIRKKVGRELPIMALTSFSFGDIEGGAKESGMNAHLAKPIDMEKPKQLAAKFVSQKEN